MATGTEVGAQRGPLCPGPATSPAVSVPSEGHFKVRLLARRGTGRRDYSAPTGLRIAQNWVMLTASSGHSLQPLTIISFLPDICPFKEGAGRVQAHFYKMRTERSLSMAGPSSFLPLPSLSPLHPPPSPLTGTLPAQPAAAPTPQDPVSPHTRAKWPEAAPGTLGTRSGLLLLTPCDHALDLTEPRLTPSWARIKAGVGSGPPPPRILGLTFLPLLRP